MSFGGRVLPLFIIGSHLGAPLGGLEMAAPLMLCAAEGDGPDVGTIGARLPAV